MRSSVHVVSTLRQTVVGVNALAVLLVTRTSGSHVSDRSSPPIPKSLSALKPSVASPSAGGTTTNGRHSLRAFYYMQPSLWEPHLALNTT